MKNLLVLGLAVSGAIGLGMAGSSGRSQAVCPPLAKVLKGVYHPSRLTVLAPCKKGAGVVVHVKLESGSGGDGDLHIQLRLDPAYVSLKNAVNDAKQQGNLVVEYMPRDGGHLPRPHAGDRLTLRGAWVLDTQHGWRELHPVWSVRVGGRTYASGPQNGGSPPGDRSGNSRAHCRDHGKPCKGY